MAQRGLTQPVQCGKYTLLPGGHSGRGRLRVPDIHVGLRKKKPQTRRKHLKTMESSNPTQKMMVNDFSESVLGGDCDFNLNVLYISDSLNCEAQAVSLGVDCALQATLG